MCVYTSFVGADAGCNLTWYGMVGLLAVTLYVPILNYRVYQTVRFIARLVMLMGLRIVCRPYSYAGYIGLRYARACVCVRACFSDIRRLPYSDDGLF